MDVALGYAHKILDTYQDLRDLDMEGQRDSELYLEQFAKLKEMITCERLFYSYLKECELEFIYQQLEKRDVPGPLSLLDVLCLPEELIHDIAEVRVKERMLKRWQQKHYPVLDCEPMQVGMVPLIPIDEEETVPYFFSKMEIVRGCFNLRFSHEVLSSKQYSEMTKNILLYESAYCDETVENYYLNTKFSSSFQLSSLDFFDKHYFCDDGAYLQCCCDFFRDELSPYAELALTCTTEDLKEQPDCNIFISIVRDALYSAFQVFSHDAIIKGYSSLGLKNQKSLIAKYLDEKLYPLVLEKNTKMKSLLR